MKKFYTRGRTSELGFEEYIGVYPMHKMRKVCPCRNVERHTELVCLENKKLVDLIGTQEVGYVYELRINLSSSE